MKVLWIETYSLCGCSSEANRKRDLLGYCSIHGSARAHVYKVPIGEAAEKMKEMFGQSTIEAQEATCKS